MITIEDVRNDSEVLAMVDFTNSYLKALGFTEHGRRHATIVSNTACDILRMLGYPERTVELAAIAGFLHDFGNVVHRQNHAFSGSIFAMNVLARLGMPIEERVIVVNAIGNHEEERGYATTAVSAALNIADKSDVDRSRVQAGDFADFDIHDRVNYASTGRAVVIDKEAKTITLELEIDTQFAQVIEYFEIFLERMVMVKQAAEFLDCRFRLVINGTVFS